MFETKNLGVKIYNLGTGQGASVLEMIKIFENISGRKIPYKITNRRPGDISTCYAKCDLAEKELNWKAKFSLKEMCMFEKNFKFFKNFMNFFKIIFFQVRICGNGKLKILKDSKMIELDFFEMINYVILF